MTPDTAIDLAVHNEQLKAALKYFMKQATPEEGQKWGFDFVIDEQYHGILQNLIAS